MVPTRRHQLMAIVAVLTIAVAGTAVGLAGTAVAQSPTPSAGTLAGSPSAVPANGDTIEWTRVDQGPGFDTAPGVYGIGQLPNGRLVVVGSTGAPDHETSAAWVSTDGSSWRTLKALQGSKASIVTVLYAIDTLDQLSVAVGRTKGGRGAIFSSQDGVHWSEVESVPGPIYDLAQLPVGLIGSGVDGAAAVVWTSSDETSWFETTLAPSGRAVHVVVAEDGTAVASGAITDADGVATPVVWHSFDHRTWGQTVLDGLTPGHWSNPSAAATPAGFVVTFADLGEPGKTGHVFTSEDGATWTETLVDPEGPLTAAGSVGADALLIGNGRDYRSGDGRTWTSTAQATFDGWSVRDVMTTTDGRLFAAGDVFASTMATWTGMVSPTPDSAHRTDSEDR